jgi:hypothetical protein
MSARTRRSVHTIGLLFLFAALSAQAEQVDINWEADGRFGYEGLLEAAAMTEICGPLDANAVVDWNVKSPSPVDFNIHYHQGEEVVYPARQNGVSKLNDRLTVTAAQTYCWMFTNTAQNPTVITLDLQLNPD